MPTPCSNIFLEQTLVMPHPLRPSHSLTVPTE